MSARVFISLSPSDLTPMLADDIRKPVDLWCRRSPNHSGSAILRVLLGRLY